MPYCYKNQWPASDSAGEASSLPGGTGVWIERKERETLPRACLCLLTCIHAPDCTELGQLPMHSLKSFCSGETLLGSHKGSLGKVSREGAFPEPVRRGCKGAMTGSLSYKHRTGTPLSASIGGFRVRIQVRKDCDR